MSNAVSRMTLPSCLPQNERHHEAQNERHREARMDLMV